MCQNNLGNVVLYTLLLVCGIITVPQSFGYQIVDKDITVLRYSGKPAFENLMQRNVVLGSRVTVQFANKHYYFTI